MADATPFDDLIDRLPAPGLGQDDTMLAVPGGFLLDLTRAWSRQDIMAVYAKWAPIIIGADRCSIALEQADQGALVFCEVSGAEGIVEGAQFDIATTLIGAVFRRRNGIVVNDLEPIPSPGVQQLHQSGFRCFGVAPLVAGDLCFGVLSASFREQRESIGTVWGALDIMARCLASQLLALSQRETLEVMARQDALTGLPNRNHFNQDMKVLWRAWVQDQVPFALLMIDVDRFKLINDTYGHAVGDDVLRMTAQRLNGRLRQSDHMARLGGEEFVIAVEGQNKHGAMQLAERCRQSLDADPMHVDHLKISVTCSFGVAEVSQFDDSAMTTLSRADKALYAAKNGGRNRVCLAKDRLARAS